MANFKGVLHADCYEGYNKIIKNNGLIHAACWAHARRYFYEPSMNNPKAEIARYSLEAIHKIYHIEKRIKDLPLAFIDKIRRKYTLPLVDALFDYWHRHLPETNHGGATAKAIKYALNHEEALRRFLSDPQINIDNNPVERALRVVAIGRNNWTFAGSDNGGETAAIMYTLIETAKLNDLNPEAYLAKVLSVIQDYNSLKLADLLPWNIKNNPQLWPS